MYVHITHLYFCGILLERTTTKWWKKKWKTNVFVGRRSRDNSIRATKSWHRQKITIYFDVWLYVFLWHYPINWVINLNSFLWVPFLCSPWNDYNFFLQIYSSRYTWFKVRNFSTLQSIFTRFFVLWPCGVKWCTMAQKCNEHKKSLQPDSV